MRGQPIEADLAYAAPQLHESAEETMNCIVTLCCDDESVAVRVKRWFEESVSEFHATVGIGAIHDIFVVELIRIARDWFEEMTAALRDVVGLQSIKIVEDRERYDDQGSLLEPEVLYSYSR